MTTTRAFYALCKVADDIVDPAGEVQPIRMNGGPQRWSDAFAANDEQIRAAQAEEPDWLKSRRQLAQQLFVLQKNKGDQGQIDALTKQIAQTDPQMKERNARIKALEDRNIALNKDMMGHFDIADADFRRRAWGNVGKWLGISGGLGALGGGVIGYYKGHPITGTLLGALLGLGVGGIGSAIHVNSMKNKWNSGERIQAANNVHYEGELV